MEDACSPQNTQSSKFAHWFVDNGMLVKFLHAKDYRIPVVYTLICFEFLGLIAHFFTMQMGNRRMAFHLKGQMTCLL